MTFRQKILIGAFTAIFVLAFSLTSFASAVRVGVLSKLNTEEGDFTGFIRTEGLWKGLNNHGGDDIIVFYDSVLSMLLSMSAGELEEIELPEIVGSYVMSSRPDYKISCTVKTRPEYLAFGFLKGKGEGLRDKFNEALSAMKSDGTLDAMKKRYLRTDGETESATFEKFAGADTIRVAVTGDLPPIDYVASDDKAAGFNTALVAEIAKRLKVNVRLVYTNTGARAASLISGRSDVVFWYQVTEGAAVQHDVPAGVILSEPYYEWDTFIHITQKNKAAFNDD